MLGLGKKKDKSKSDDQTKKDTPTDGFGYPAGSGIVPDDLKQKVITDQTAADTTQAEPQPTPAPAQTPALSAQPTTPAPAPAPTTQPSAAPAQPVGFIDEDDLQVKSTPAQELTEAEKKRKELLELIQRQQAGVKQEEPISAEPVSVAPTPATAPVEPTPPVVPVKEEKPAEEITPAAATVEPVAPAPVPTPVPAPEPVTAPEEKPPVEAVAEEEKVPLPARPFAPAAEEETQVQPSPSGTLEQRIAKLETEMAELKKQVSKWV